MNTTEEEFRELETTASEKEEEQMEEIREARDKDENAREEELIVIDGAKIKFNSHLGDFKALNDVPTTQDKRTGTIVENQLPNFTFYDGFTLTKLSEWQNFGQMKVQDNQVLIKASTLPGEGQMPGSSSVETGQIEFVDSGQVNIPESIDVEEAPIPEDPIKEAYFAKKVITKIKTNEPASNYTYKFNKSINVANDRNTIASNIIKNSEQELIALNKYISVMDVLEVMPDGDYEKDSTISIPAKKIEDSIEFEKIDSSALEGDIYVYARTENIDGKEITIEIREKEEFLVGASVPLPVLERDNEKEEAQNSDDLKEIIHLKGIIKDNTIAIPIRLRPKSEEGLQNWQNKIAKGKEDGTYVYTFNNPAGTKITTENKEELSNIIAQNANTGKFQSAAIEKGKEAYGEEVVKVLEETTYSKGKEIEFPIFKTINPKLWLKTSAPGNEGFHEKEFLNESDQENANKDKDPAEIEKDNYFVIGGVCTCEAKIRAYMRMLRVGEGTVGEKGYTTRFGNAQFSDMSTHPGLRPGSGSSAAGAYQVMQYTFWEFNGFVVAKNSAGNFYKTGAYEEGKDYVKKYNITDFSAESQDILCVALMKHHSGCASFINDIISDKIESATRECGSRIWASLPHKGNNSRYLFKGKPQPVETMSSVLSNYNIFLEEELKGQSDLHLKSGFLKEFGYDCCSGSIEKEEEIANEVTIHYVGQTADSSTISSKTKNILKVAGKNSNNLDIYITSTARVPYDQARIMYENTQRTGAAVQKSIYAAPGRQIIDVYTTGSNQNLSKSQIIANMEAKINEIGPSRVSKHLANPEVMNTFDVSISRLKNPNDFRNEMRKSSDLDELLTENGAYHIQINQ